MGGADLVPRTQPYQTAIHCQRSQLRHKIRVAERSRVSSSGEAWPIHTLSGEVRPFRAEDIDSALLKSAVLLRRTAQSFRQRSETSRMQNMRGEPVK